MNYPKSNKLVSNELHHIDHAIRENIIWYQFKVDIVHIWFPPHTLMIH